MQHFWVTWTWSAWCHTFSSYAIWIIISESSIAPHCLWSLIASSEQFLLTGYPLMLLGNWNTSSPGSLVVQSDYVVRVLECQFLNFDLCWLGFGWLRVHIFEVRIIEGVLYYQFAQLARLKPGDLNMCQLMGQLYSLDLYQWQVCIVYSPRTLLLPSHTYTDLY
jgi:hypothetical protein